MSSGGIVESSSSGETAQTQQTQGPARSKLIQRLLSASSSLPQFINDLLKTQASVVAGTEAAGFLLERKGQEIGLRLIAHIRPDNSSAELRAAAISAFQEMLKPCIAQGRDGAIEINTGDLAAEPQFCLVTLLRGDADIVAVSAVITRCMNLERAQQRLTSMQLVAGYFELYTLRHASDQAQIIAQSHQHVLQLATAVATAEGFESAAMNLCNELATRTGASRVTLGWLKGDRIKVKAFSHTEEFDKKQELVVQIEKTMEECLDQEEPVQFDPDNTESSENVTRAAQVLSRSQGGNSVLSLPLRRRAEIVGVVTMEFSPGLKLTPQASTALSVAVDLLGPQLYDRYVNDRWLITKTGISIRDVAGMAVGPKHMTAKLIIIAVIAVAIFINVYRPMYHVSAPFQFVLENKRKIDMPFDGYLKNVYVKPGDHVKKGAALIDLDDTDFVTRRAGARADRAKADAEYQMYSSKPEKQAEAAIAKADRDRAQAEYEKYDYMISLAHITAPFDGLVLKGDLTDQVNSHKQPGEELMWIAEEGKPDEPPMMRAELEVPERDIQKIRDIHMVGNHSTGQLATVADPTKKFDIEVDRIVPMGEAKESDNIFTVYAKLITSDPRWQDGMRGDARINVERKSLAWIWTHKAFDWLRLKLWLPF